MSSEYEELLKKRSQSLRQPLIVQVFVRGYEVEVPLLDLGNGPLALEAVSITLDRNPKLDDRILDYEIVYHDGFYFSHSDHLGSNTVSRIEDTAENVFVALGIDCVRLR